MMNFIGGGGGGGRRGPTLLQFLFCFCMAGLLPQRIQDMLGVFLELYNIG